jgi:hypothetical protein
MKRLIMLMPALLVGFAFVLVPPPASGQQPMQSDMSIDAATRTAVIENLIKEINDNYVFAETGKKVEADMRNRMKNKGYDEITSARKFAEKLTEDLRKVSHDKHLGVTYSTRSVPSDGGRIEPTPAQLEKMQRFAASINYGFDKIDRFEGNIGYLRIDGFMPTDVGAETAIAAMNFLANTNALIFDLRYSVNGGDPAMSTLLSSYLFGTESVHLSDIYWREGNRTRQIWTMPYVPGKRYVGKDVYFLTSRDTISAGEGFVYDLQNLKRITVIGETTAGAANPGFERRIGEHFIVFVPMGRAINPLTKTNWEGTGVEPDIKAPREQALKIAYLMALTKSAETMKDENMKNAVKRLIEQTQKELDELKKVKK